ncbi:uncharacterized protein BCR38DRAFT_11550 [Pseudomassariella vexata]|uniref:Uncharacterized protein n=1 Tax=Pseudomassariella vexata TaxID=1141098 RepID=A0A1Y2EIW8_9PEZI|nr:uncharacterized protein BCR38DRAFT_11550 [Pseudomassariella vexata]ORY71511.1 hypothetical protein BCR38DRAFT_11550 [Pseudomassariella vexata]
MYRIKFCKQQTYILSIKTQVLQVKVHGAQQLEKRPRILWVVRRVMSWLWDTVGLGWYGPSESAILVKRWQNWTKQTRSHESSTRENSPLLGSFALAAMHVSSISGRLFSDEQEPVVRAKTLRWRRFNLQVFANLLTMISKPSCLLLYSDHTRGVGL